MPIDLDDATYLHLKVSLPKTTPRWIRPYTIDHYDGGTLLSVALGCAHRDPDGAVIPDDIHERMAKAAYATARRIVEGLDDAPGLSTAQLVWIGAPMIAGRVAAEAVAAACHATDDPQLTELARQIITAIWPSTRRFHRHQQRAMHAASLLRRHLRDFGYNSRQIHPALDDLTTLARIETSLLPQALHHLNRSAAVAAGGRSAARGPLGTALLTVLYGETSKNDTSPAPVG